VRYSDRARSTTEASWDCCLGSHSGSHWEMLGTVLGNTGPDIDDGSGRGAGDGTGQALTRGQAGCFTRCCPLSSETQRRSGGSPLGGTSLASLRSHIEKLERITRGRAQARALGRGAGSSTGIGEARARAGEAWGQSWELELRSGTREEQCATGTNTQALSHAWSPCTGNSTGIALGPTLGALGIQHWEQRSVQH
jgi:hypothetical protein